jgi:hypothetical protein
VRNVLTDLGDEAGGQELGQGDLNRGWPDGPSAVGERGGELVKGVRAASSERCEYASGGRSQFARGVGELGDSGVVGAVEVVARQHGAGALDLSEGSLARLPSVHRRDRGVYLGRLASAYALGGSPDIAVRRGGRP